MKRCPSCNRTYPDDTMTNCGHDGAPLMFAAYTPQEAQQPFPTPQGYAPPPPPGYPPQPPGAPWQNYPPVGYPPLQYPPQAGWQAGMGEYVPCPRCRQPDPEKVKFTWWGGMLGPRMFKHVKCRACGLAYNGKSGQSNTTNIVIYSIVAFIFFLGLTLLIISIR